ncbi:MAG TPA: DUF2147 domain-containing protein [Cytophagales bacterium]|jgi:uncharacterized protein (DUF2147 family)|nr:DUF2147 domain-containing protein [Cytophagales bacterium]
MPKVAFIVLISSLTQNALAQIVGSWTSIDDNSGKPRSVIEIVERGGKFFGKIVTIHFNPGEPPNPICDKCEESDQRFKKKIIGMKILDGLVKEGNEFGGGNILDPENGKVYRCKLWLEDGNLKVRGYWGPFFRTQTWRPLTTQP